jgi:hypothetical protein
MCRRKIHPAAAELVADLARALGSTQATTGAEPMRPFEVLHTRHRRPKGKIAREGSPSRYHLCPLDRNERDAKDRADAKAIAERARAAEAAELEAAAELLRRGTR